LNVPSAPHAASRHGAWPRAAQPPFASPKRGFGHCSALPGFPIGRRHGRAKSASLRAWWSPSMAARPFLSKCNLGDVMKESAETALSAVLGLGAEFASRPLGSLHIHVPDNAAPKEGPSAGVTIAVALASAILNRPVRDGLAMTGEITLRGKLLAVGGIREKLVAARRAGMRTVLLPEANRPDMDDVPSAVRRDLDIVFCETAAEAIRAALARASAAVRAESAPRRVRTGR
jgi:hypothetical protein